jgi:hypothetical protein
MPQNIGRDGPAQRVLWRPSDHRGAVECTHATGCSEARADRPRGEPTSATASGTACTGHAARRRRLSEAGRLLYGFLTTAANSVVAVRLLVRACQWPCRSCPCDGDHRHLPRRQARHRSARRGGITIRGRQNCSSRWRRRRRGRRDMASDHHGGRGAAAGEAAGGGGELIVPCTGTGVTLLPRTKGGPSTCVSPCNLGLVLGYPERGGIFRCKTRDQGRMSARYRHFDSEGAVRLVKDAIGGAAMSMRIFHPMIWGAGPHCASRPHSRPAMLVH